ncbi:MAG: hypothetical protein IT429_22260 [Gemmataceae bacterium]|nr:hypothetical protein [Gemmataceae bacterium]
MFQEQLTQALSIPTNPTHAANRTSSFNTGGVDMQKFERCLAILDVGTVTAGTLDAKWQESADNSSFSDVAGYANLALTQIAASNKTVTMEIRASHLSSGKRYVRVAVTLGGSPDLDCAVILLGGEAHQKPASAADAAHVTERKVVS